MLLNTLDVETFALINFRGWEHLFLFAYINFHKWTVLKVFTDTIQPSYAYKKTCLSNLTNEKAI